MCFGLGGGKVGDKPSVISPPDPAKDAAAKAEIEAAKETERVRNLKRKGRSSSIVTGGLGIAEGADTAPKTLLGS